MCLKSTLDTISGCKSFYSTSWCKSIERLNSKITLFKFSQYQNPHDRGLRVCGFGAHLDAGDQRQPHQDRRLLRLRRAQARQVLAAVLQCETSACGEKQISDWLLTQNINTSSFSFKQPSLPRMPSTGLSRWNT